MRIRIYTDGACSVNPGPGGWAIVVNTDTACIPFAGGEPCTTNNRMELMAMIEALRYIANGATTNDYEVFCDSAYVVNALTCGWLIRWKLNGWQTRQGDDIKNRDLWECLDGYISRIRKMGVHVSVKKIKGHNGHTFNEMADKLARAESMKQKAGGDCGP